MTDEKLLSKEEAEKKEAEYKGDESEIEYQAEASAEIIAEKDSMSEEAAALLSSTAKDLANDGDGPSDVEEAE